ncbi:MAG: hypothetical protein KAR07_10965, partial [Spirochaetes bacterium]|nr:hypothetical protein [Spirochaetota bacterium]
PEIPGIGGKLCPEYASSIPAIEDACIYYAIKNEIGQLKNIQEIVNAIPELKPWKEDVKRSFLINEISIKILNAVKNKPKTLQNKIKNEIDISDGRLVSNVIHYLENVNKIKRNKTGNTYEIEIQ